MAPIAFVLLCSSYNYQSIYQTNYFLEWSPIVLPSKSENNEIKPNSPIEVLGLINFRTLLRKLLQQYQI